jgi:hypothetical protein
MSAPSDQKPGSKVTPSGKRPYAVGYGKPPAEHRFPKGQSGNPLGRPRKPKALEGPDPLAVTAQAAIKLLLKEAYRQVRVREGDRTIEMPVIQAVLRRMGVEGATRSNVLGRHFAELVMSVEAEDRKNHLEYLEALVNWKGEGERAIEEAHLLGRPEPELIPHPDDVVLDFEAGIARICGPQTKQEKAHLERLLEDRNEHQRIVSWFADAYRKSRGTKSKGFALKAWKLAQKFYDNINDDLPKRYREELRDRCSLKGASKPGEQRTARWPGDDL